jgi:hypothetical protein
MAVIDERQPKGIQRVQDDGHFFVAPSLLVPRFALRSAIMSL